MSSADKIDVFQFMALRAPETTARPQALREYVHDTGRLQTRNHEYADANGQVVDHYVVSRGPREPFRPDSDSVVGKLVYNEVFVSGPERSAKATNAAVVAGVLEQMAKVRPQRGTATVADRTPDIVRQLEDQLHLASADGDVFYLLPSRLRDLHSAGSWLVPLCGILRRHAGAATLDKPALLAEVRALFPRTSDLWSAVYLQEGHDYTGDFWSAWTTLWDTLYQLYILRRVVDLDLLELMDGIRAMRVLELLAADACLEAMRAGTLPAFPGADYYAAIFEGVYTEHAGLRANPSRADAAVLVRSVADLRACLEAEVVLPPIVAELGYYARGKFNAIKPYLGDLKVVKQWLRGYRVGEIARIVNIMSGEEKIRSAQVTDRRVDALAYSSEATERLGNERQTTDKYDVKQEAESVLKTQVSANASASTSAQYEAGYKIQVNVGAGFAYANSSDASSRSANAFAREVIDKAVSQVERRTSQNRSITTTFETIDRDRQKYVNTEPGAKHVSGIYRWLDKRYEAQLYNFGKRWMLEFMIPEPAAFLVESRLQATAKDMRLPKAPEEPSYDEVVVRNPLTNQVLTPGAILPDVFAALASRYDLSGLSYPAERRTVSLIQAPSGSNVFSQENLGNDAWRAHTYSVKLGDIPSGYSLTQLIARGSIDFEGRIGDGGGEGATNEGNRNRITITLGGMGIYDEENNALSGWRWQPKVIDVPNGVPINGDTIDLTIGVRDAREYSLTLDAVLSHSALANFQASVYNRVLQVEQARIAPVNEARRIAYESARSEYLNALAELNALSVNELIQGRSEAFNASVIREELKRQCISVIAHEFDMESGDDVLSSLQPTGTRPVEMDYPTFSAGDEQGKPFARFEPNRFDVDVPSLHLPDSRRHGRFVQFLEQAFEWGQLSYVFYPYFWGRQSKWLELMNRLDYSDSQMSAFLRAGAARVLIAVTPGFYDAVMYFLATREPWGGGATPVIGDPLFIPIHEEIRRQQDDLANAVADGPSWTFTVPTNLVYLQDSTSGIPGDLRDPPATTPAPAPTPAPTP